MKIRIKMGDMPGDIPRSEKIAMMEKKHPDRLGAKGFRKLVLSRRKAVLKHRLQKHLLECALGPVDGTLPSKQE